MDLKPVFNNSFNSKIVNSFWNYGVVVFCIFVGICLFCTFYTRRLNRINRVSRLKCKN